MTWPLGIWTRLPPRRRRFFAAGAALALGLGAAGGHWLPDWGLRWGVVRALHELGWSRVGLGEADLSLFDGAIVVRQVVAGASLGEALGIGGLDLTFRWRPLLSRRVSVKQLDLSGVDVEVRRSGDGFVVNGLPVAVGASSGGGAWSFDITALTLSASRLHVIDGAFRAAIDIDRLELDDLKSWDPAQPARYRLVGRLNGRPVMLDGTATPFADAAGFALQLSLDGLDLAAFAELAKRAGADRLGGRLTADLAVTGDVAGAVRAEGKLALAGLEAVGGGERLTVDTLDWRGQVGWNGKAEAAGTAEAAGLALTGGAVSLTAEAVRLQADSLGYDKAGLVWDGTLTAERPVLALEDLSAAPERLDWAGHVEVAAKAASRYRVQGRVELLDARVQAGPLAIEAGKAVAEGSVADAVSEGDLPPLAGALTLGIDGLALREPGHDWLAAQHLDAREVTLTPGGILAARLAARGLRLLGNKGGGSGHYPWRVEARTASAERVAYGADGGLGAASVTLGGAMLRVTRTKDGLVGLTANGEGERPAVALGRLRLPDARLEFEDRTPPEPVRLLAEGVDFTIADLDSRQPEREAPFAVKGRLGAAMLSATGRARPFAVHPGGELKGEIRALELPALSPYAADALGIHLHTGQLDADITLAARQGKLDGGMELTLSQLFVAPPDADAPLVKKADMPLETVLDLLRDSDNRIRLSIPVRGDLDNPDFDVSDAVNQAIGGALKSTVFTTLKVAFPVAALIGFVIDEAEKPRLSLEPLTFPPGSDMLGEAERAKLKTIAQLFGRRPGLKLTLCGIASPPTDWPVLLQVKREEELGIVAKLQKMMGTAPKPETPDRDRLAGLADARAQAAKSFLVESAGIDAGRLFTCRPKVDGDAQAGRVDLLL